MGNKNIVDQQLQGFEKMLKEIVECRHEQLVKMDRLLGVQKTMFVFTKHLSNAEAARFQKLYDQYADAVFNQEKVA